MLRKSVVVTVMLLLTAFVVTGQVQADGTPTPEPDHGHMAGTPESDHHAEGTPEANDAHDHGPRLAANGAAVKIVAPQHNAMLDRDNVIVRVETSNWPLGEAGHHWHLLVNGKEQGMSQGNASALQAHDLQPGENIIEAVLSNELHQELDATHRITVHYSAADRSAATNASADTAGLSSGVAIVLVAIVAAVAAMLGIGFAVTRRKA